MELSTVPAAIEDWESPVGTKVAAGGKDWVRLPGLISITDRLSSVSNVVKAQCEDDRQQLPLHAAMAAQADSRRGKEGAQALQMLMRAMRAT